MSSHDTEVSVRRRPAASDQSRTREKKQTPEEILAFALLEFEDRVREITDTRELGTHLCNSTRDLIAFNQSFFGTVSRGRHSFSLKHVSSVPNVDRNSPFKIQLERTVNQLIANTAGLQQLVFDPPEAAVQPGSTGLEQKVEYLWTPQIFDEELVGGFIVCRTGQWSESELGLLSRLTNLYGHARSAIEGRSKLKARASLVKPIAAVSMIALVALSFVPVPISALAPLEVSPAKPFILTAPFDGVVKEILPSQGQQLSKDEIAIKFDDVHLRNRKKLAEQEMAIASANYQRISQSAIADYRVKRDIEVAKAEFELAQSESEYANQLLQESQLTSPVNGVAIYSAKSDWEGKPVSAGEAILSIADPDSVELTIYLPVKDSLVLENEAKVRVFLDSDPLNPLDAVITEANYSAAPDKRDVLSYRLTAQITNTDTPLPRIGIQGTAQVYGEQSTLGYVIFRRPYSALRQLTGW